MGWPAAFHDLWVPSQRRPGRPLAVYTTGLCGDGRRFTRCGPVLSTAGGTEGGKEGERRRGGRHGAVSVNTILYPPPEHLRFIPFHTVSHSRCSVSLRLLPGTLPAPVQTVQAGAYII